MKITNRIAGTFGTWKLFFPIVMAFCTINPGTFQQKVSLKIKNSLDREKNVQLGIQSGHEKPFVIVIASYNNEKWYTLNLDSVFKQNYNNYRVIYVDDLSPDGTGNLVENYIKKQGVEEKITLIKNKKRRLAMANLYNAIHMCGDNEIVLILDGDDWLAHPDVLSRINHEYLTSDIWLTYGSYEDLSGDGTPPKRQCKNIAPFIRHSSTPIKKCVPTHLYAPGHPKTFYAWLFKQIKLKDFLYKGSFAASAYDYVFGPCLQEMARNNYTFIADILYEHNIMNVINDHKAHPKLQNIIGKFFLKSPTIYKTLPCPIHRSRTKLLVDAIVFSEIAREQLVAQLKSITQHISGLDNIFVVTSSGTVNEKKHEKITKQFKNVTLLYEDAQHPNWHQTLIKKLSKSSNEYVLLVKNSFILGNKIDITQYTDTMKQTFAYTFLLENPELPNTVPCNKIKRNIYAWQFKYNKNTNPQTLNGALYNKEDVLKVLKRKSEYNSIGDFEKKWLSAPPNNNEIGLTIIPIFKGNHKKSL